jgi:hypothetical protein
MAQIFASMVVVLHMLHAQRTGSSISKSNIDTRYYYKDRYRKSAGVLYIAKLTKARLLLPADREPALPKAPCYLPSFPS